MESNDIIKALECCEIAYDQDCTEWLVCFTRQIYCNKW